LTGYWCNNLVVEVPLHGLTEDRIDRDCTLLSAVRRLLPARAITTHSGTCAHANGRLFLAVSRHATRTHKAPPTSKTEARKAPTPKAPTPKAPTHGTVTHKRPAHKIPTHKAATHKIAGPQVAEAQDAESHPPTSARGTAPSRQISCHYARLMSRKWCWLRPSGDSLDRAPSEEF
jgi:hypothetical protein